MSLGLGLTVFNHAINYNFESNVSVRDTSWYYSSDSVLVYDVDITYQSDTIPNKYNAKNRFVYLSLPLKFAYGIPVFQNTALSFEGGLIIDFLISSKGYSLSQSLDNELVSLSSLPLVPVSASVTLGPGITRKIKGGDEYFINVKYSSMINSLYAETFPIRSKRATWEFGVGFRWK